MVARVVRRKSVADLHGLSARHAWATSTVSAVEVIETPVEEITEPDTATDLPGPCGADRFGLDGSARVRSASLP